MDRDDEQRRTASLEALAAADRFAALVGAELVEVEPGYARATLVVTDRTVNVHQMVHGGATFTLADLACEAAGNSLGEPAVAVQTSIQFLAPGRCGDTLVADAKLVSRGEGFGVVEFEVRNEEGRLLSSGHQTIAFRGTTRRAQR